MESELVRLRIVGITYNQIENGMYALVLEEEGGNLRLPIIIGYNEAQSIECIMQRITTPRPLTHEFASRILDSFGIRIESVLIRHLPNGIFAADVTLVSGDEKKVLDARSSDAIAIAMRADAPIFATREMMEKCGVEKESFSQQPGHIVSNQSIAVRQAVARVRRPEADSLLNASADELQTLMRKAVEAEDYEKADEIKKEIEKRLSNNSQQS